MSEASILARKRRHWRIKRKVVGTSSIPRLSVFRSLRNIYVQFVDDVNQKNLFGCSTLSKRFLEMSAGKETDKKSKNNKKSAELLGKLAAEIALEKNIKKIVFDRSGYRYHGRIKALADSARKAGLVF